MLAGCAGRLSTLAPAGRSAAEISHLWWVMFAGATAIFLLVMILLGLAFARRREATEQKERTWILGGGLIFTSAVLIALLTYGIVLGERLIPNDEPSMIAEGTAEQWGWTFRQPAADGTMIERADILDIPVGAPVDLRLTSSDVIHSFWVPRLAGKLDAVPGKVNTLRIEASKPGIYEGTCAEYCGIGHSRMRLRVIAHDPAAWASFQAGAAR